MINLKLLDTRYDEFVKKLQGKNVKAEVLNELLTTFNELKQRWAPPPLSSANTRKR